ncbi:hypothetical protein AMS68_006458 [Peltaster fructicola]|uniref:PAS domain-containing protein n=1 Tax=Peltaster fructicola TaxID=286661 RepID=A0A6H0Y1Y6_9PEZI|nr:hypothetical protein AMS68_006458 [Peltaster fructicola]
MDATFITIHDLTPEARLLYSSDSVIDILGYTPDELVNRSCWDFFPQQELPYARKFHQKRVVMDKAAVLVYCRVRSKSGEWIGCECCFTIVYDVMIVCTSRYRQDESSEGRALAAPVVRRLFTSSPKDPRYHMLSHLSSKFTQSTKPTEHEPRAALFLNRFTRTLTIMYATSGIDDIIGISAETMRGKSFYYCVAENCLPDAIKCLEHAKGNHSIAYLRFWFRDPRTGGPSSELEDSDEEMTTDYSDANENTISSASAQSNEQQALNVNDPNMELDEPRVGLAVERRASSGDSGQQADTHESIFGQPLQPESSASSLDPSPSRVGNAPQQQSEPIEIEAVISCASDGLVVCMRKARPMIPHPTHRPGRPVYPNGLFAAPWAHDPVVPPIERRPGAGFGNGFAPSLGPRGAQHEHLAVPREGPDSNDFLAAIRDQAIFAWALTGINGALADYGQGKPSFGSLPHDGLAVWESDQNRRRAAEAAAAAAVGAEDNGQNERVQMLGGQGYNPNGHSPDNSRPPTAFFGDPGLARSTGR